MVNSDTLYFISAAKFDSSVYSVHYLHTGKVVVHCYQGVSRSATIVAAFLMLKRGMSAEEALKTLRKKREIFPNEGFLNQLCSLNNRLALSEEVTSTAKEEK